MERIRHNCNREEIIPQKSVSRYTVRGATKRTRGTLNVMLPAPCFTELELGVSQSWGWVLIRWQLYLVLFVNTFANYIYFYPTPILWDVLSPVESVSLQKFCMFCLMVLISSVCCLDLSLVVCVFAFGCAVDVITNHQCKSKIFRTQRNRFNKQKKGK